MATNRTSQQTQTTRRAPLNQPSKKEIAHRQQVRELAQQFVLVPKHTTAPGTPARAYFKPQTPQEGVELIKDFARHALDDMFAKYPTVLSGDDLTAAKSAVNMARKFYSQLGHDVTSKAPYEPGSDRAAFALAEAFFQSAIAWAEEVHASLQRAIADPEPMPRPSN